MASEAVLKYLMDTNRPYSCADVTVNLRGAYTKNAIQKALDALSESGKIKCKLYGKQKVYAALQLENLEENTDTEDYDTQISRVTNILNEKKGELKKSEAYLKNLLSAPTNDMTKTQIEDIKTSTDKLEKKLNYLRSTTEVISAGEKKTLLGEHEKSLKEYRKRKRISSEMLEAVLEGCPKSKKSLIDELCLETDEMVNFKLKTV